MLNKNFIDQLPQDPLGAAETICRIFNELDSTPEFSLTVNYESLVEIYAVMTAFLDVSRLLTEPFAVPRLGSDRRNNLKDIRDMFTRVSSEIDNLKADVALVNFLPAIQAKFGEVFSYEFSEGDFKRIQELLNELREVISASQYIGEDHRARLLRRLEKLQAELHKKLSDLDRFWGLIGEAGVVAGKFGSDAKPIVDLIKEITNIVWRAQSWAEGLPTDMPPPLLEPKEPDKK